MHPSIFIEQDIFVTGEPKLWSSDTFDWRNTILIPPIVTLACLVSFTAFIFISKGRRRTTKLVDEVERERERDVTRGLHQHAAARGADGDDIPVLTFVRLVGCLGLVALSVYSVLELTPIRWNLAYFKGNVGTFGMLFTYCGTTLLAAPPIFKSSRAISATRYCNTALFFAWATLLYRDVWPLLTFRLKPLDVVDTKFWVQMTLLTIAGVFVPLFIPREYVPVNPQDPARSPHPEQVASIASLILYTFMTPIVHDAANVSHLSHNQLPALADYDHAHYLVTKNSRHLDPFQGAKNKHLFFNLVRIFRLEFTVMCLSAALQSLASFLAPTAVNRLLNYFETEGGNAEVSPWVWVICLFAGPMVASVSFQWYNFYATHTLVRVEGLLVQLVFDHSLRIRCKAEAPPTGVNDNEKTSKNKGNLVGRINTLVTVDVDNIGESRDIFMHLINIVLDTALGVLFLYTIVGWSSLVGLATIVVLAPLSGYFTHIMQDVQMNKLEKTDARVQAVSEAISVLRMIKLFGWELHVNDYLTEKRRDELAWLWKEMNLQLVMNMVNFLIPVTSMIVTYSLYTLVMKQPMKASTAFSSLAAFEIIQGVLYRTAFAFTQAAKGKVSLDRVGRFLAETELLDSFDEKGSKAHDPVLPDRRIGFSDAVFTWSKEGDTRTPSPSSHNFRLRVDGTVLFKEGVLNLVVGPTGSGKTSLLMALLGEMHFIPPNATSWFNLPRDGGVAYAAQESWVQNETIKENILFGSPYDEERYNKVLHQCALERDLELFEAGDATEVGERGLTLSGGQKARVTLARAVYSSASIVLLDDVLAALDVHTSKWIVDKCLSGDLLKGRTVILVTHNVALTNPISGCVVAVGRDGHVQAIGSDVALAVSNIPGLAESLDNEPGYKKTPKGVDDAEPREGPEITKPDGKLMMQEEVAEGRLKWKALRLYVLSFSRHPVPFVLAVVLASVASSVVNNLSVWYLGYWGDQYETQYPREVNNVFYLAMYSTILVSSSLGFILGQSLFNIGTVRASRVIHSQLVTSVLAAPLRWLDETPAGRILARATQDIGAIDSSIPWQFQGVVDSFIRVFVKFAGPVYLNPIFALPIFVVGWLGSRLSSIYLRAQLSVKREQSNAKGPLLSHFGAVIAGLVSVRAYGAQEALRHTSFHKIDHYIKVSRTSDNLNRWIGVRMDALGAIITAVIAAYLLGRRNTSAANTGYTLNMCVSIFQMIFWTVRLANGLEVECNKLERIQAYLEIEHEPAAAQGGVPPAAWPKSGDLVVENLSARYSAGGPEVLHDLSFTVKSGERIGVVGRTGSGKSSLALALLRCIITEGTVYLDGLPTSALNLDALRSAITIIPQTPELLTGTLRRNLDPFHEHDDATLNNALRSAGLLALQDPETREGRLTLDSAIASGGGNLSVGQRQIIALARAMVRNSKLLILDEATSAIDHKTDAAIQTTLRTELGDDVTVLTIAHRLQTIMDADKVMVLDAGRIVEFDSPRQLLRKNGGVFKSMIDESGDRAALYELAHERPGGA